MFLLWRESVLNSLDLPETFKTVLGELLEILNRDVVGFNGDIHTVPREKLKSFIAHLTEIEYGTRFILQCGITSSLFLKETIDSGFYESFCNDVLQLLDDDLQQNSINSTDSEQKVCIHCISMSEYCMNHTKLVKYITLHLNFIYYAIYIFRVSFGEYSLMWTSGWQS